jgi:hypothetical protein
MTEHMSREQRNELITARRVTEALLAVINDTPTGAHRDLLFAPLQQYLTRDQFEQTMRLLVEAERISRHGERYYPLRTAPTDQVRGLKARERSAITQRAIKSAKRRTAA